MKLSEEELKARKSEAQKKLRAKPEVKERQREHRLKYRSKPGNKERMCEYARKWRATPEGKRWQREYDRKVNFNLEPGEWEALFLAQGSKCALCSIADPGGKYWATDHCHSSGRVRGILCHNCNLMLGHSRDNPAVMRAGADYVERHSEI